MLYSLLRKFLFLLDAEKAHYFTMNVLKVICKLPFAKQIIRKIFCPPDSPVTLCGLQFKNPVGLAAGFDKNAKYLDELSLLGFGFIEIGTVTPLPQSGNLKPRLFRLPKDQALINRMGFNNDGVEKVADRVKIFKEKNRSKTIIGGNIGKNKITPNENAWKDYETCFLKIAPATDYVVVNVSSPNTPGLRDLQQKEELKKILAHLIFLNKEKKYFKPIFLKIAPDLNQNDLDDILNLAIEIKLDGLIINNTTISREHCKTKREKIDKIGAGGLSGKPLLDRSNDLIKYVSDKTNQKIPIIGSGGIITAGDAIKKINQGSVLIQIFTGFIYQGPSLISKINKKFREM